MLAIFTARLKRYAVEFLRHSLSHARLTRTGQDSNKTLLNVLVHCGNRMPYVPQTTNYWPGAAMLSSSSTGTQASQHRTFHFIWPDIIVNHRPVCTLVETIWESVLLWEIDPSCNGFFLVFVNLICWRHHLVWQAILCRKRVWSSMWTSKRFKPESLHTAIHKPWS